MSVRTAGDIPGESSPCDWPHAADCRRRGDGSLAYQGLALPLGLRLPSPLQGSGAGVSPTGVNPIIRTAAPPAWG